MLVFTSLYIFVFAFYRISLLVLLFFLFFHLLLSHFSIAFVFSLFLSLRAVHGGRRAAARGETSSKSRASQDTLKIHVEQNCIEF